MESITIINKSGKVVSTVSKAPESLSHYCVLIAAQGKHLVNIFKEAKEAYAEKKAALHAEHHSRIRDKNAQKLKQAREQSRDETQSIASSRHSHRSHRSHRHGDSRDKGEGKSSRPPLTMRNLDLVSEGGSSVASGRSRRSKSHRSSSHHGENRKPLPPLPSSPLASPSGGYRAPFFENANDTQPSLVRRNTDFPGAPTATQLSRSTLPPPYTSQVGPRRVSSVPDMQQRNDGENIDMNLAYGAMPPDLNPDYIAPQEQKEIELAATMSKLDTLLLEAQCLQHSATAIITNLQANPEAMAAVALTLAELSNLLAKMGPGILTALKGSSPAIFALLASPQFMIAGGVAIGVTVVMFGGFKIIKKLQAGATATKEANRMEEALVYEGTELSSIDNWRRGIAEVEAQSVSTSVDGEFITPEALRQKKERIRDRAREERVEEEGSVVGSVRSERTSRTDRSRRTLRRAHTESVVSSRDIPERSSSKVAPSEDGSSASTVKKGRKKEVLMIEDSDRKLKKASTFSVLFKKNKDKSGKRESELSHRPKLLEL